MVSERKRYKTSELIREKLLTIGDGYRATNSELGEGGIPFARAGNINDGFNFGAADLLKPASIAKAGEKVSQSGDVVFTSKGTVGRFAFVRPETPQFAYSPQLCYWRSRNHEKLDPRFLFYWMQGPASWSQINWAKGQTDMADYVSLRDQRDSFWLDLPSPDEQRRIAHILGALDDKIELNRQLNTTLEQLARSLFQSWFVDFDPVRAKASGEPEESICRRLGLTPELLTLFPAVLEETEKGELPVGWRLGGLGDVVTIFDSKRIPLSSREREVKKGIYPYYGAAAVMDYVDDFLFDGVYVLTGEDGSVLNPDGTPIIQYVWGKFWANNHAHVLKGANGLSDEHLFIALKNTNISA